jgi:hypothetical protein
MRRTTCFVIAWAAFGCTNATVMKPQSPDGSPDGRDAAADVALQPSPDSASAIALKLDVRLADAGPMQEDGACSRTVSLRGVTIARPVPFDAASARAPSAAC